jgi:hypothetical protein
MNGRRYPKAPPLRRKISCGGERIKMRIKKDFLPCFLPVIGVLCFVLLSPAFAEFKKVSECELARNNASRIGQLVTTQPPDYEEKWIECKVSESFDSNTEMLLAEGKPDMNGGGLFTVHDDYGYNWLQNLKAAGDLYYEASATFYLSTVKVGTDGGYGAGVTYAIIGLGSQEAQVDSWDPNVTLGPSKATSSTTCCMNCLCSIHLDGLYVKVNGTSYVTLYKSEGQLGISTDVDVTIDRIRLATLSFGDCDGFTKAGSLGNDFTNAGYVGLKDTNIIGVTASGSLAISVAKVDGYVKAVHMGIDNMYVGMSSLDTTVELGDKKDFSGTVGVLGTIYMKGLQMQVSGYLDIYNPAANSEATTLGFGLKVPLLTLKTLSWGDSDGFAGARQAGYIGLSDLTIKNLSIVGQSTFYEKTVQAGDTGTKLPIGTTFVYMGLSDVNVSMAYMTTDMALGNRKDNLNQVLCSVSWSNVNIDVNGSIQISAH